MCSPSNPRNPMFFFSKTVEGLQMCNIYRNFFTSNLQHPINQLSKFID